MSIRPLQSAFFEASIRLASYGLSLGYEFTWGDCNRPSTCSHGHKNSAHRHRLAVDLNLFVDGEYITDGKHPAFKELHDYWDKIGGAKRIKKDMNHFSFEYAGVR